MPSAARLDPIKDDFFAATSRLTDILAHVDGASIDARIRVVISNNVIVSLVSTVEEAVRDMLSEYLAILEDSGCQYAELKDEIQKANLTAAVSRLTSTRKSSNWADAKVAADGLSACFSTNSGWLLFKNEIVHNDRNFRSDHLTEIIARAGIKDIWKTISSDPVVETFTAESK